MIAVDAVKQPIFPILSVTHASSAIACLGRDAADNPPAVELLDKVRKPSTPR